MSTTTVATPGKRLRAYHIASPVGVDRENRVIRGYIIAEVGEFKSGRGRFDLESLKTIERLINEQPDGIKCRYGHPGESCAETLDSFVGWSKHAWLDGERLRGDLHLSDLAFHPAPGGGKSRGEYILDRADKEPHSFGSSLELDAEMEHLGYGPPLWRPTLVVCSDIVDSGDAVHSGFLAETTMSIEEQFAGLMNATTREEAEAWFANYIEVRFPISPDAERLAAATELRRLHRNRKLLATKGLSLNCVDGKNGKEA